MVIVFFLRVLKCPGSGTSLYRFGEGPGSWLSRTPVHDPVNSLALPVQSESTATQLNRFVTTRPVSVVEGGVSPQPGISGGANNGRSDDPTDPDSGDFSDSTDTSGGDF